MYLKLIILTSSLVIANPVYTGQYPAGIDPASCPNYPICENPLVAISQNAPVSPYGAAPTPQFVPATQYAASPRYTASQYSLSPQFSPAPVQYAAAPQYQQLGSQQYQPQPLAIPQYAPTTPAPQYAPEIQNALDRGEYIGDGDYHGEGVDPSRPHQAPVGPTYSQSQVYAAPGYAPINPVEYNPAVQPVPAQPQPAQIPAGLDPNYCPNYPFCHS